jgi:tetratricopeptide (TPR) repeat protein
VGAFVASVVILAALTACDDHADKPAGDVAPLEVPSDAEREAAAKFAEAKALVEAGREKQAEALLRRVVELSPRHPKALALLSEALMKRRAYADAAPYARTLVDVAPDDQTARKRLYDALYGQSDFAGAEEACHAWTKTMRDDSEAWFSLGTALYAGGHLEDSVKALRQAAALKATRADIRSQLGLVLLAQGKLAEAEAAQKDAVQRDPHAGEAWFRLGEVVSRTGPARLPEAIESMRRAVKEDPKLGYVHLYLYRLLRMAADEGDASRAEEAEAEWKVVLRIGGRDILKWGGLGSPPSAASDAAKDEKALRAAVVQHPDDAEARYRFALAVHRRGDLAEAANEYAEAILAAPADAKIRAALGAALLAQGDAEHAEPQLREAVRLDATDATSWRNLGWALVELRRDADAMSALDEAMKRRDGDHAAAKARALARMHKGEVDEGLQDIAAAGWIGR